MPSFFEPKFVGEKTEGPLNVRHEEHRPGVPAMRDPRCVAWPVRCGDLYCPAT